MQTSPFLPALGSFRKQAEESNSDPQIKKGQDAVMAFLPLDLLTLRTFIGNSLAISRRSLNRRILRTLPQLWAGAFLLRRKNPNHRHYHCNHSRMFPEHNPP